MNKAIVWIILFGAYCNSTGCKKPYAPPAIQVDNKYLVIEGVLINSPDSPSVFTLSRTVKLTDTATATLPESGATLSVEGNDGSIYNFTELSGGVYQSQPLSLISSAKYRLRITTSSGEEYASDFVEVKQTPPIDSITWQQQNDVMIYLNTHDPSNNTRYYRWDFAETYQYEAPLQADLSQNNGVIFYVDNTNQTFDCWRTVNSSEILLGSSIALSQDVINKMQIANVPKNSQKITIRYSILVKQYALTREGYQYFSILKKNTEGLGTLFDAQPSQLSGNIHSVKNPSEIVIGFFSASSVQQKRIFISKTEVTNWNFVDNNRDCSVMTIIPGSNYPDPDYYPYYFSAGALVIARRECVDCRVRGGVNQKPTFW